MTRTADAREMWHELRGYWRADPVRYAVERLGISPTHQQRQLLEAIAPTGAKVSARAGHGVGKSTAVSCAIWWFLECFDYPKIPCTAPTASQLRDVLWSEVVKVGRGSDVKCINAGWPKQMLLSSLFRVTQDRIMAVDAGDVWFAVARTARKENPDALQGFHASNLVISEDGRTIQEDHGEGALMFVVEEASGVPDQIYEVAEGALSSKGSRLIMVGNPTKNDGYFARSHKQNRGEYTTLHFSCADSPLVDPDYRPKLVKKFGEGSNVVRVRADGEFPKQDDDVLISVEDCEQALSRPPPPQEGMKRILGVDVARFGDDRTTFVLREGDCVEYVEIAAKLSTMEVAGKAIVLRRKLRADYIHVDEIGVGAGVVDRLKELKEPVLGVNVANVAPERKHLVVDGQGKSLRDYLWLETAEFMKSGRASFALVDPDVAQDLSGELCSVKYKIDSQGRIVIESKDEMKKRGLRSPDIAEGLMLTFAPNVASIWERLAD